MGLIGVPQFSGGLGDRTAALKAAHGQTDAVFVGEAERGEPVLRSESTREFVLAEAHSIAQFREARRRLEMSSQDVADNCHAPVRRDRWGRVVMRYSVCRPQLPDETHKQLVVRPRNGVQAQPSVRISDSSRQPPIPDDAFVKAVPRFAERMVHQLPREVEDSIGQRFCAGGYSRMCGIGIEDDQIAGSGDSRRVVPQGQVFGTRFYDAYGESRVAMPPEPAGFQLRVHEVCSANGPVARELAVRTEHGAILAAWSSYFTAVVTPPRPRPRPVRRTTRARPRTSCES